MDRHRSNAWEEMSTTLVPEVGLARRCNCLDMMMSFARFACMTVDWMTAIALNEMDTQKR
jgi:hypothetical protein